MTEADDRSLKDLRRIMDGGILNPEIEEDTEAHLEDLLEEDKELKELWETDKPKRSIGIQILRRRTELGWSQRELATKLNTSQNRVHLIESGEANPTVETLYRLADALGLELEINFSDPESDELIDAAQKDATESVQEAYAAARQLSKSMFKSFEQTAQAERACQEVLAGAAEVRTWNTHLVRNLFKANEHFSRALFHDLFNEPPRSEDQPIGAERKGREFEKYRTFIVQRQENAFDALWRSQEQALELLNENLVFHWERSAAQDAERSSFEVLPMNMGNKAIDCLIISEEKEEEYKYLIEGSFYAYKDLLSAPIAYYTEGIGSLESD